MCPPRKWPKPSSKQNGFFCPEEKKNHSGLVNLLDKKEDHPNEC
jgi:hypothetical protein